MHGPIILMHDSIRARAKKGVREQWIDCGGGRGRISTPCRRVPPLISIATLIIASTLFRVAILIIVEPSTLIDILIIDCYRFASHCICLLFGSVCSVRDGCASKD